MSGPKKADVQLKLTRAVQVVESQLKEEVANAARLRSVAENGVAASQHAAESAEAKVSARLPVIADATPEEETRMRDAAAAVSKAVNEGRDARRRAQAILQEANATHENAQRQLGQCAVECAAIAASIRNKAHYLHAEDLLAADVRRRAEEALMLEKQAGRKIQELLDHEKLARNHFDRAVRLADQAEAEQQRIGKQAEERCQTARIAEATQREAVERHNELRQLEADLCQLNHEKFRPGAVDAMQQTFSIFREAFAKGDFERVVRDAATPIKKVRALIDDVRSQQAAWDELRQRALNELDAADGELKGLDRIQLAEWCDDSASVDAAYDRIDSARNKIENEQFEAAQAELREAIATLRRLAENAGSNKAKFSQREQIAEAIMQALYDQNYDSPEWYFAEKKGNGDDNRLGDVAIFAKAPGEKGDMRMLVDLNGKVNLEVQNIPEGEEAICHDLIHGLQNGLANEVEFTMRDWGRAEDVSERRIQMSEQQKDREITRERESD